MLAREGDKAFDDKDWLFEVKWDGYRAIAELNGKNVLLYSRNGNTFNGSYPQVVDELKRMNLRAMIDGEIVVLNEKGLPDFQLLQHYDLSSGLSLQYCVFDLLSENGKDTCALTLIERKERLKKLLKKSDVVIYSDHIFERGKDFFEAVVKKDMEGMMAKKADSLYYPGRRTSDWLKIKNHRSTEAVIAGFTAPAGSRKFFGALILGIYEGGELKYAGHTGTGFSESGLKEMAAKLKPLITGSSPFSEAVKTNMPATWVEPHLVCEIKFTEWTRDGKLRHPVFVRLRPDKPLKEVTMENELPISKKKAEKKSKSSAKKNISEKRSEIKNEKEDDAVLSFGKIKLKTTHNSKIFWPNEGITKGDVIKYYQSVAEYILPYLKDRPQSLKRNPNGINDRGFYHKDAGGTAPSWVKSKKIFSESAGKEIDYIICNDAATLAYLNNLGCIEINPWHSTVAALDHPDYLVIDIDPSAENTFDEVVEAANVIHDMLEKAGADSFCKTSGVTGMHVYIPAGKKYTYDQLKNFAELICLLAHEQLPRFTSMERNLQKRGNKHIYLDHLQNRRGQTIACAYSLRPHEGATVSTPLKWNEVKSGLLPSLFTIRSIGTRLEKNGDIFKGILGKGIDLKKCLSRLEKK